MSKITQIIGVSLSIFSALHANDMLDLHILILAIGNQHLLDKRIIRLSDHTYFPGFFLSFPLYDLSYFSIDILFPIQKFLFPLCFRIFL